MLRGLGGRREARGPDDRERVGDKEERGNVETGRAEENKVRGVLKMRASWSVQSVVGVTRDERE